MDRRCDASQPTPIPLIRMAVADYTWALRLVLWYPFSLVAALWFVAIVPPSHLAGVLACLSDEFYAPSF